MAERVLSIIAGEILKKLSSPLLQEISLWWGVKDELDKLKPTVLTIHAVLLHADNQPTISIQLKNYIDNLKEVLYDADDLLDDFSTEALRRQMMSGNESVKEVRIFFSLSNQFVYGRKMGHKIKAIRERLDAIKGDKEFHIGEGTVETQVDRETDSFIPSEDVIGREEDKRAIIELLLGSNFDENVMIIPIVGIGGLGKTTLAQFVYNDDEVKFDLKLWVVVSDVFNVKTIVKKIIKSATNREPEDLELDQLQNQLRKELDGKKYLLVLDDVWNEDLEKWLNLKKYLMGGARGSRILVTTRSHRVAEITSEVSPYVLKGLSETDSWSLFVKMAFREQKEPTNQNIVVIGKEIVEYCAGVPLAIRAMGSMFKSKKLEHEWTSSKIELSELVQLGGGILPTLKLSYNNLKPHLKHCFAYCRLFPKDCEIDIKTLIYHWIGQGFIKSSNSSQTLEQIGYEFFLFLLGRCFFHAPKKDEWGNVEWCKMHDLMHDLAVEVAGEESTTISLDKKNIPKNTHHVSVDYDSDSDSSWEIPVLLLQANKIRTFLWIKGFSDQDVEIWSHKIVLKSRYLRILDLHGSRITRVPHSIGKLKHLKYLDLSSNFDIMMLPSSITRLQNLLVINLSNCRRLEELPEDIKKLVSLTHLEIGGCHSLTHMPQGLGQLTSLEKLTKFKVSNNHSVSKHCGGLNELNGLNNLRGELIIYNLNHVKNTDSEYKAANLEGKKHLRSLVLKWGGVSYRSVDIDVDTMSMEGLQPHRNLKKLIVFMYPGVSFPSWLSSLPNLVKLELSECLRVKHLKQLDGLSSLQHLLIESLVDLEYMDYGLSSLTNLVNFQLRNCERVKHLPPLDGLTSLRHLSIEFLTDLEYIDCNGSNCSRATFFSSLEDLVITKCPNLKGWRNFVSMETPTPSSSTTDLPPFPCLSRLEIQNCESLTLMPPFPSIDGRLYLVSASGKPLQQTMMMKSKATSTSTSISSSPIPLSKLKFLWIEDVHDLEYLPDEVMQNLTSLESLDIWRCHKLLRLAGEGFSGLTSLCSLEINNCQRLNSMSGVFQYCTALEKLVITQCKELDFSDDMQCQGLKSFSLQELTINSCPKLSERCGNNIGVDWPKIAHIPLITIDYKEIQSGGCYQLG